MIEYKDKDGNVLHCIYRLNDCKKDRCDFTSEDKYLQGCVMRMNDGKSFKNHKHIRCDRETDMTHEAWIVFRGKVKVKYYDNDEKYIGTEIINAGDCTITFGGGHKFFCIEDDTLVYEFKNGPYYGRESDKVFIDD